MDFPVLLSARKGDLIEIPVIVTDKKGNFIRGLNKYDFEIYESRKNQDIVDFYLREIIDGRLVIKHENGEIEEKTREFLIIFDQSSIDPFVFQRIKEPLNNFLKRYFNWEDTIYFIMDRYTVAWQRGELLHVGQKALQLRDVDFKYKIISGMVSDLIKEVVDATFSLNNYPEIPETPDKEWYPRQKPEEYSSNFEMNYEKYATYNLLDRLKAIALAVEKIKGEKTALFISEGPQDVGDSPFKSEKKGPTAYITGGLFRGRVIDEGNSFMPTFDYASSLGELFSHSKTTFYSVFLKPVRLKTPQIESTKIFKNTSWETDRADPMGTQSLAKDYSGSTRSSYSDTLRNLSKNTGGIILTSGKKLNECLSQIGQAMSKSYVLLYSSSNKRLDGKFRKIEVKVKRKGVKVRHRKGYYAIDMEREELKELVKSLKKKKSSENLITFVRSRTIPLGDNKYYLLVKIEPKGLVLNNFIGMDRQTIASSLIGQVRIYFELEDEKGKLRDKLDKKFDFKINGSELDIRPAIYFGQELEKGKYRIKIALKDKIGEEITTNERIVEIGEIERTDEKRKGFKNLFFVRRNTLVEELNEIKELFIHKGEKIYPRLNNEFKPEENLDLFFEVDSKDEKGIDLYFRIIQGDKQPFKTYKMSSPLGMESNPFLISIPLSDFPYGEYIFQIIAIERGKRKHHIARKDFKVAL